MSVIEDGSLFQSCMVLGKNDILYTVTLMYGTKSLWDPRVLLSFDNLYKKSGPRSGPTKCRAWSGSKLFDTLMVFLKEFKKKQILKKKSADDKKWKDFPACKELACILWQCSVNVFLQELTLSGYDVASGEELSELGHKIHYANHNGVPVAVSIPLLH